MYTFHYLMRRIGCTILIVVTMASGDVRADESISAVDYLSDVKPVLRRSCYACHGTLKQEGGLRLDTADALIAGGDSGPAINVGNSNESLFIERVSDEDESTRMPQEGAPLSRAEIAAIRDWIDSGAQHPEEPVPPDPLRHWSFVPPVRSAVPDVQKESSLAQSTNPIDRFIAARQVALGLTPVDEADRYSLLRRVSIDLTGLPPTREEIDEFVSDNSQDAYERLVDRLLASPRYGERWARHWMDVWRYSDWDGHGDQVRESQPFIWRWRDWIVESLNKDKPYDQMITEMIAGDELAPDDPATLRATGFLARNYHRFNRNTWLENTVEHTGKAFLGLTLNCAKCHDHKYDPIAQQEYYEWRAAFEPYDVRIDPIPGQTDTNKDGLTRVYDAHADSPTYLFVRGDETQPEKENPLTPALPRILGGEPLDCSPVELPSAAWYPGLRKFAQEDRIAASETKVAQARSAVSKAVDAYEQLKRNPPAERRWPDLAAIDNGHGFISERFAERDEALWHYGKGTWEYHDGGLRQADGSGHLCMVESKSLVPADFVARVKFVVRGGDGYQSVGMSFDFADHDNFSAVYMSAGSPGLEVLHRVRAAEIFPPESRRSFDVKRDESHELVIAARGLLINVWVDNRFVLAYSLPAPRPASAKVALWTYEAVADFQELSVDELDAEVQLVKPEEAAQLADASQDFLVDPAVQIANAQRAKEVAEAALAVAEAERTLADAAAAADLARYSSPPASDAQQLIEAAIKADRVNKSAAAEQALVLARHAKEKAAETSAVKANALAKLDATIAEADKAYEAAAAALEDDNLSGDYTPLGPTYPKTSTGRRLALAAAITDRDNPLTARVAVNQIWLRHFGAPLVPSVFDFGLNGKPPTHPELLDWLAVEFMEGGWRMKSLHRLIVTSRTYRLQSSDMQSRSSNRDIDRDNINLWRMNSRRLEAEAVRDAVLYVAENLDTTMGGPDLDPSAAAGVARRSLYFRHSKEKRVPFLSIFDQASVTECYRRAETVVPQQALAMANSELVAQSARPIAEIIDERLGRERANDERFIEEAFLQVLDRPCSTEEQRRCLEFLDRQPENDAIPVRERFIHVLLNHHDFVTLR